MLFLIKHFQKYYIASLFTHSDNFVAFFDIHKFWILFRFTVAYYLWGKGGICPRPQILTSPKKYEWIKNYSVSLFTYEWCRISKIALPVGCAPRKWRSSEIISCLREFLLFSQVYSQLIYLIKFIFTNCTSVEVKPSLISSKQTWFDVNGLGEQKKFTQTWYYKGIA